MIVDGGTGRKSVLAAVGICTLKTATKGRLVQIPKHAKIPIYKSICEICGAEVISHSPRRKYCGRCQIEVRHSYDNARYWRRVDAEKNIRRNPDREFTEDTVFLVKKWYKEGMSIKDIADVLSRSRESVIKALKTNQAPRD